MRYLFFGDVTLCLCTVLKHWEASVISQENSYHIWTACEKYPVHILGYLYFFVCKTGRIYVEHNYVPCLSGSPSANFVTHVTHNCSSSGLQKLFCWYSIIMQCVNQRKYGSFSSFFFIYRMSQEECEILRESVPYVKLCRYNPKHLYPKLNGYGINGHRKVWASLVSTNCTPSVTQYSFTAQARQGDFSHAVTLTKGLYPGSSDVTR